MYKRQERYEQVAYDRQIEAVRNPAGQRNPALYNGALCLFSRALGGWFGHDENRIEADLLACMHANGYIAEAGERHALSTIRSARRAAKPVPRKELPDSKPRHKSKDRRRAGAADAGTTDTAPAEADDRNPLAWTPYHLPGLVNAERVEVDYITELDLSGNNDLLIKSDTGQGKSTAIKQMIAEADSVLVVVCLLYTSPSPRD